MLQNNGFIYLAGPYTSPDPTIQDKRFIKLVHVTSKLMMMGYTVVTPVLSGVPLSLLDKVENSHEFWMQQDLPVLNKANEMLILALPGWQDSTGLCAEMYYARLWDIPYQCISYKDAMKGKFNAIRTQPIPDWYKNCTDLPTARG